jgi:ATP-dependent RNA helicase DHX29
MKEMRYNPITRLATLQEIFIAKSNATQRAGRAGRVCPGTCFRLYEEEYFNGTVTSSIGIASVPNVLDYGLPEIQRIPLEEIILQILLLQLSTVTNPSTATENNAKHRSKGKHEKSSTLSTTAVKGRPELFLLQCIESPSRLQIQDAIACLIEMKAVNVHPQEGILRLTCLGYHLAKLPVDVHIGKMLIYASLLQVSLFHVAFCSSVIGLFVSVWIRF